MIIQLRMRQARYYLRETELPVKEVSRRIGLNDPLRFSKLYRHFWGHAPMTERL
jgi:AraC-like DNA-binding protein